MFVYTKNTKLDKLELSAKTCLYLKKAGIATIVDFLDCPLSQLFSIKNIGVVRKNEIINCLYWLNQSKNVSFKCIDNNDSSFIGLDGKRYYDVLLEDIITDDEIKVCFNKYNINQLSQLLRLKNDNIVLINNEKESYEKYVMQIIDDICLIPYEYKMKDKYLKESDLYFIRFIKEFSSLKRFDYYALSELIIPIREEYLKKNIVTIDKNAFYFDDKFISIIYNLDYIKSYFKLYIIEKLNELNKELNYQVIFDYLPRYFANKGFLDLCLSELLNDRLIKIENSVYVII